MSYIAIMMFVTLSIALGFGIYQFFKMKKELPEDTSDIEPLRKLQQMERETERASVRGAKQDPYKA